MKTGFKIFLGLLGVAVLGIVLWAVSLSNSEIKLRNRANAEQEVCAAYFDKMWKILQQKAGVTEQYKDGFKEIYSALMEGRYSDEGKGQETFMKWVQESNPQFDASLYKDLMNSIEGERNGFFIEQQKLIDIDRQHKDMRMVFPASMVLGKRADLGIKVIKSLKTDQVYETKQENDIDLFAKKPEPTK